MRQNGYLLYIGTYTNEESKGIYVFRFNPDNGEVESVNLAAMAENPSYLITNYSESVLYSVYETDTYEGKYGGGIGGYQIDNRDGKLTLINQQPVHGLNPCHLCVNDAGSMLITANYSDGSISVFPLFEEGRIAPMSQRIKHEGSGLDEERQEGPHMHYVTYTPEETCLYAVDLGIDQIKLYHFKEGEPCLSSDRGQSIYVEAGAGPRHLVFHPGGLYFYVVSELTSKVMVFRRHVNDTAELLQTISALPDNAQYKSWCSAIKITPDGRFLYVANRGHDSITSFSVDENSGELTLINYTPVGGEFPRDIEIDPEGNWLFAANQESNEITAFMIQPETGVLRPIGTIAEISKPTCISIVSERLLIDE